MARAQAGSTNGQDLPDIFEAVLNRAPDVAGAESFVKFLLSKPGERLLKKVGLATVRPVASGKGVPYLLGSVIRR